MTHCFATEWQSHFWFYGHLRERHSIRNVRETICSCYVWVIESSRTFAEAYPYNVPMHGLRKKTHLCYLWDTWPRKKTYRTTLSRCPRRHREKADDRRWYNRKCFSSIEAIRNVKFMQIFCLFCGVCWSVWDRAYRCEWIKTSPQQLRKRAIPCCELTNF